VEAPPTATPEPEPESVVRAEVASPVADDTRTSAIDVDGGDDGVSKLLIILAGVGLMIAGGFIWLGWAYRRRAGKAQRS
jgi:hypothetical protein